MISTDVLAILVLGSCMCVKCISDLARPKSNEGNAGFTIEERQDFTDLLAEGFVDSFCHLYPDKKDAYSYWSYRGSSHPRNVGW